MPDIAASATVHRGAQLADDVVVGPGCVIEDRVSIGPGCVLKANVYLAQGAVLGRHNTLYANVVLGEDPQILHCAADQTRLLIGDNNVFRENVTISRGSPDGEGQTVVGNGNYFSIGAHVGHDATIEDHVMLGNCCQISGHSRVESHVWFSGMGGCHQFSTLGKFLYVGGMSVIQSDQPPFMRVAGAYPSRVRGLNLLGLRRAGINEASIDALTAAHRKLYLHKGGRGIRELVAEMVAQPDLDENVRYLLESLQRTFQHRHGRHLESFRHGR